MSARTEKLLEQINRLKSHIVTLEEAGEDSISVKKEVERLTRELTQANQVLSEGKVIKG